MDSDPSLIQPEPRPVPLQPALHDPWAQRLIPLDGFLEGGGTTRFMQFVYGFLALGVAFVGYLFAGQLATVAFLLFEGVAPDELMRAMTEELEEYGAAMLLGNAVGQVFGLALLAWVFARLHTRRVAAYLRLRAPDLVLVGLAILGLAALFPAMQWLAAINQEVPLPPWLQQLEDARQELLEQMLMSDTSVLFNLLMIAITPALCEELLFRGYVQRAFERGGGAALGIFLCGTLFGMYHLSAAQVLPLVALGIYLAYLAWRTGSLWTAVIVHFANNGFYVVLSAYATTQDDIDLTEIESLDLPWWLVVGGTLAFFGLMAVLHRVARQRLAERRPVPEPPSETLRLADEPPPSSTDLATHG